MKMNPMPLRALAFMACLLTAMNLSACDDSSSTDEGGGRRSLPNSMTSVTDLNFETPSGVFPLYRGQDMNGGDVFYIITESNEIDESIRLGLNWTPKLVHVLGTRAVQTATMVSRTGGNNVNDFPVVRFSGNVDFSPERLIVPGRNLFPLNPATTAGSVGDANYSPVFTIDGEIVYNAAHVANSTGLHDDVLSMDTDAMKVTMKLVNGFYEGFPILYTSTEASDEDLSALETATFAPNLNFAPFPGDDKPFRSAREALIHIINGPMGRDNPIRQGLRSAVASEGDPLNIFQEQAGCENPDDPAAFCDAALYSPLWDVHPVMWTQEAIDTGVADRITTDKREVLAPKNVIDLLADGFLVPGAPGGPRNSTLGGLPAAGIIVNCPIVFVPADAR